MGWRRGWKPKKRVRVGREWKGGYDVMIGS